MLHLIRPPLATCLPDAALQDRYEVWRATKIKDLAPNSPLITSRWDQFVRGAGEAREVGPALLTAVKGWQHNKCAWCESVEPRTVDHVELKAQVPRRMFDWDNLLASCGDCNNARSHYEVAHEILVVPTRDEPLKHFRWDAKTGECVFEPADTRALETVRALAMHRFQNERLHKLQRFRTYLAFLLIDVQRDRTLDLLREELEPKRPYLCILRSWLLHPPDDDARALRDLAFAREPVLFEWVRPWLLPWAAASWPISTG
jgi:hypothetical protein